jgi:hypothetical protein
MADATAVTSYVVALGPVKLEICTGTFASSGDTYVTKLVSPKFVIPVANFTTTGAVVTVITGKSIAFTNAQISANSVHFIVVGF